MESILGRMMHPDAEAVPALAALVAQLRPRRGGEAATLQSQLQDLIDLLETRPETRAALRAMLLKLFSERHAVLLFATSGIYPETGVITETFRRISHKILPEADDAAQLKSAIGSIFCRRDLLWLDQVTPETWGALFRALRFDEAEDSGGLRQLLTDLLEAVRVVAHRIAAAGLEPEMLRLDPDLENHQSPFLALCEEALLLTRQLEEATEPAETVIDTQRHLLVLVDQCRQTIERVRRRAQQSGASFNLTFRLRRLSQHLKRLKALAELVCPPDGEADPELRRAAFWVELLAAECRRNDLRRFWRQNTELMALRVTENAGKSGEHYITETRPEYYAMLRSAAGGGFVIAFMAANKYLLSKLGLAPLAEVLAFSLNYALGFVLIHMLHFTVATKQPAMTANAIAAAIGETQGGGRERERDMQPLVQLVARTLRTQFAAILGNIGIAIPMAMLLSLAVWWLTGSHFVDAEKARQLLQEIDPIGSGAVLYAAVAGVCLFLAGLIAGYYDNLCGYNRIPQRLLQLEWPRRIFGQARWQRVAAYVENHLGALAGNFFFGFLLGGASGLGMLLGLPLDIRHIAFSSAYWGYALAGLEFGVSWQVAALGALGVLLIGLANLLVSFYLAMWVGLKARGVDFAQRRQLLSAVLRHLRRQPREFFLPPKAASAAKSHADQGY
jgi:site-specific recombinase